MDPRKNKWGSTNFAAPLDRRICGHEAMWIITLSIVALFLSLTSTPFFHRHTGGGALDIMIFPYHGSTREIQFFFKSVSMSVCWSKVAVLSSQCSNKKGPCISFTVNAAPQQQACESQEFREKTGCGAHRGCSGTKGDECRLDTSKQDY